MTSAFSVEGRPDQEFYDLIGWCLMKLETAKDQPEWVCHSCGVTHGFLYHSEMVSYRTENTEYSTYHMGTCGVCEANESVTQPKDYGYLLPSWEIGKLICTIAKY